MKYGLDFGKEESKTVEQIITSKLGVPSYTQGEEQKSLTSILSRFKNGEERFRTDPLFNQIIQQLLRGKSPLELIDDLLEISEERIKLLENYIRKGKI